MKRRNFLATLAALPFAAKPLAVLAAQKPTPEDLLVRQLRYQAGMAFKTMTAAMDRNFYGVSDGDYLYYANDDKPTGVVTEVDRYARTITVSWSRQNG